MDYSTCRWYTGDSQEEQDENLKSVLNSNEEAGMTLNKKKCVLGVEEVEFLGFKVGKGGIKAGPKIQGIVDFPVRWKGTC